MATPNLADLRTAHWQPSITDEGVMEGLFDVDQAIRILLTTPQGSDPHRPEFGSKCHIYLDWPVNRAIPHLVREATEAIRRWEPRCEMVKVIPSIEGARVRLRVQWKLADGVIRETEATP